MMTTIQIAVRRTLSVPLGLALSSLLLGGLLGVGCARQPPQPSLSELRAAVNAQEHPYRPPEMSSGAAFEINGYGITVPPGMVLTRSGGMTTNASRFTFRWQGATRANGSRTNIVWELFQALPGVPAMKPARVPRLLASDLQNNAGRHTQFVASRIEPVTVHGLHAFRYYWKGVLPLTQHLNHGFVYFIGDKRNLTYIRATDGDPYSKESLPLCEKAALSFHKL